MRPTKLGDAIVEAKLLDYDLQRQVYDDLQKIKVFRGYGHGTHVLDDRDATSLSEVVKCLRADIRYFKWRNGVVGHTTVVWSAHETPSDLDSLYEDARDFLAAIDENDDTMPPSLVYAAAALLEGCSFVNGSPSSAGACPGVLDLARQQVGVYCLGPEFHSAVVTADTLERLGHQDIVVSDRSSDTVQEVTSLGFLSEPHTLVTYAQSNEALRVAPFIIDVAVWCDFFSSKAWSHDQVTNALQFYFAPDRSTHTRWYAQLQDLKTQAQSAVDGKGRGGGDLTKKKRVRIRPEEKTTEWAIPNDATIICAGLACVDMQLNQATGNGSGGGESIETFEGEKSIGGGSVSMACKTLARLCHGAQLEEDTYMQVTPPVVHSVIPLCKIGNDDTGHKLIQLLEHCGSACRNVETKYIKESRKQDAKARTALAVLPIYKDGRRGCFFDAASNATFSSQDMINMLHTLSSPSAGPQLDISLLTDDELDEYHDRVDGAVPVYGAFLFGYPHLLPQLQGGDLARVMVEARDIMIDGGIVALDLNGVPEGTFARNGSLRSVNDLRNDAVIGPALKHVDLLHMNEDELTLLTGCRIRNTPDSQLEDEFAIASAINLFLLCGVGIVAVTRGKKGSFVSCNDEKRFDRSRMLPSSWVDCTVKISAATLPHDAVINTNGAGDSFTAGLLVAAMLRHTGMSVPVPDDHESFDSGHQPLSPIAVSTPSPKRKAMTPYQLYMRENYVMLKQQCKDDKKAIFTKCHEMWEYETEEVKAMYERKARDEETSPSSSSSPDKNEIVTRLVHDFNAMDASTPRHRRSSPDISNEKNVYMTNRALNLESAVQFASLVAAHHVDVSTRDELHIDVSRLLDRSLIIQEGLEEI